MPLARELFSDRAKTSLKSHPMQSSENSLTGTLYDARLKPPLR
jgi:hypothetical protein